MKKYFISLSGLKTKNEIEILADGKATVNGKLHDYEYKFINDNILILRINNKNYFFEIIQNDDNEIEVSLDSKVYKISCRTELDFMTDGISKNKVHGNIKMEIHSPMPGIIKSLNVKEGQKVSNGEVILVLEAMKMENEIRATRECIIKMVKVEAMSSVEKNELLIVLE